MTTSPFILEYHDNDRDNHYQLIVSVILTYITLSWFNQVIYLMKRVCLWMYLSYRASVLTLINILLFKYWWYCQ